MKVVSTLAISLVLCVAVIVATRSSTRDAERSYQGQRELICKHAIATAPAPGTVAPGTGQPATGQPSTWQPSTGQPATGQPSIKRFKLDQATFNPNGLRRSLSCGPNVGALDPLLVTAGPQSPSAAFYANPAATNANVLGQIGDLLQQNLSNAAASTNGFTPPGATTGIPIPGFITQQQFTQSGGGLNFLEGIGDLSTAGTPGTIGLAFIPGGGN